MNDVQTCYRHDQRRAGVRCQRCDRPICPDCMRQASVGFHCPECVRQGSQKVYTRRDLARTDTAVVTLVLIALNVAVYVASVGGSGLGRPRVDVLSDFGLIGLGRGIDGLVGVAEGEWYRLVTGGFLHGSLLHLGFNMYALWLLGQQMERVVGRLTFTTVYTASLLAGSFGVMLAEPLGLTVGASGAVFGLFGYAVANQRARGINPFDTGLGGVIVINLFLTFAIPNISIGGHLGGLVGGFLCGQVVDVVKPRLRWPDWAAATVVGGLGLACAVAAVVAAPSTF